MLLTLLNGDDALIMRTGCSQPGSTRAKGKVFSYPQIVPEPKDRLAIHEIAQVEYQDRYKNAFGWNKIVGYSITDY